MSNRELIDKLRRNPRGVMFELEHECADALEKAEAELAAIKAAQPSGYLIEEVSSGGGYSVGGAGGSGPSAISDEMVSVPREPTDAMLQAALAWREFAESQPRALTIDGFKLQYRSVYRAMIAAAQEES